MTARDKEKRSSILALLEAVSDYDQTASEAKESLEADGVDVSSFLARVQQAVDVKRKQELQAFVVKRFNALRRAPGMFAYTREAFAAQVWTLLDLLGVESRLLMVKTFGEPGKCSADIDKLVAEVDDVWARALVDEAMALAGLEVGHGT